RQCLEIGKRDCGRHECHALVAATLCGDGVCGSADIMAVRRGVDDHATLDAQKLVQGKELFFRRIGGGVAAADRERKTASRPENMDMGVAGKWRQTQLWPAGCGGPAWWFGGRRVVMHGHRMTSGFTASVRSKAGS